jgi:anti-sigma factor (TIGR02949 family)
MNCHEMVDRLIEYLDGELTPEEAQRMREHLCECPPCGWYVQTYTLTIQITRRLPSKSPPEAVLERLRQAVKEEKR